MESIDLIDSIGSEKNSIDSAIYSIYSFINYIKGIINPFDSSINLLIIPLVLSIVNSFTLTIDYIDSFVVCYHSSSFSGTKCFLLFSAALTVFLFHCAASLACSATCIKSVLDLLQSMRLVDLRERWLLTLNMPGADARRCNIYAERERERERAERGEREGQITGG